jgi:hypothetical protein
MAEQANNTSIWHTQNDVRPGKYPYVNITQTESGHISMMDDTPGNERVRTQHRTGTFYEIDPSGSTEHVVLGNGFSVYMRDRNIVVKGTCNIEILGDSKLHVRGDCYSQIDGQMYSQVAGNVKINADGNIDLVAGKEINIDAGGEGGDITFSCENALTIKGDLAVSGSITSGGSINATTNLTCGYKLFSHGGIDSIGGVNVGFTIPGYENSSGKVIANVSMLSPKVTGTNLVEGATVKDAMGSMQATRGKFNGHNHASPKGPTSPPRQPMP